VFRTGHSDSDVTLPIETFGLQIDQNEFKERWLRSPSVRTFESGGMSTEEFARNIVAEAENYGMQAVLAVRIDAVSQTLEERGVLD